MPKTDGGLLQGSRSQIIRYAYRMARQAGLNTEISNVVALSVAQRVVLANETLGRVLSEEIRKQCEREKGA